MWAQRGNYIHLDEKSLKMGTDSKILKGLWDCYVPCLPNGSTEKLLNVRIYKTPFEEYIWKIDVTFPKKNFIR